MSSHAPSRSAATPVNPWLVLASTGLAVFAVFLDTTILFVAFSAIGADFPSVDVASLSWVLNARCRACPQTATVRVPR